jgi:diguanylate cyclase (GGDEF)-like protein
MAGGHLSGAAVFALDPGTGLLTAIMLAAAFTAFALLRDPLEPAPAIRRRGPSETLSDLVERRDFQRRGHALVEARIDPFRSLGQVLGEEARRKAFDKAAKVLRAGLRRSDVIRTIPGEGFVIVIEGARETEAAGVAERLRRALAQATFPGLGDMLRVTASFGVAEGRTGESPDETWTRAGSALDAAMAGGEECVVLASEIEEVLFLPPPALRLAAPGSRAA